MQREYFDLHVHAVVKNFLTEFESRLPSQRDPGQLVEEVMLTRDFMQFIDESFLHLLQSQGSISQLSAGNLGIGVAAIAPLELGYTSSTGFFGNVLRNQLTAPLDQQYFKSVATGAISYLNLFLRELELYRRLAEGNYIEFISRKKNNDIHQRSRPGVIFAMEGGHALSCLRVGQTNNRDPLKEFDKTNPLFSRFDGEPCIGPVSCLTKLFKSMWANGMDLLYLTLTHLTHISEQYLATHAFGLKLIKHPAFYPSGSGLSDLGKEVISAAYEMKISQRKTPILIDINHMSLQSRMDFYAYRKANNYGTKYPIVASHMGVTGYNIKEWRDALEREKCRFQYDQGVRTVKTFTKRKVAGHWGELNSTFTFNSWSINLMDEDIVAVINSKGIIGLILDVRILGFQSAHDSGTQDSAEFLSTSEFANHFPNIEISGLATPSEQESLREAESWLMPTKEERHPLCFCFNIVHIHCIGKLKTTEDEPLKYVCLGSDYDGLIEPLKICREFSDIEDLEYNLLRWLPIAARAYQKQNGGSDYLFKVFNEEERLVPLVRDLLYYNGRRFVENWLQNKFD